MKSLLCLGFTAFVSACSVPVTFAVDVDEDIRGGTLTLNGKTSELTQNLDGQYWGKWGGSDASGEIELIFLDGENVRCPVGYVTHGMIEPQKFIVSDRDCKQVRYQ